MSATIELGPVWSKLTVSKEYTPNFAILVGLYIRKTTSFNPRFKKWEAGTPVFFLSEKGNFLTGHLSYLLTDWFTRAGGCAVDVVVGKDRSFHVASSRHVHSLLVWVNEITCNLRSVVPGELDIDYRPYLLKTCAASVKYGRGLWSLATNAGKTYVAAALIAANQDRRSLLLAPWQRSGLAVQGYEVFRKLGMDVSLVRGSDLTNTQVVWATTATLHSRLQSDNLRTVSWLRTFDILVKDEVHECATKEQEVLERIPTWARFGMSGSLFVKNPIHDGHTVGYFGPVIATVSNSSLVDLGVSAKPFVYCLRLEHGKDITLPDSYREFLRYIQGLEWRNELICNVAIDMHQRGFRTVIMCAEREAHAVPLLQRLKAHGVRCAIYTGSMTIQERDSVLKAFARGLVDILVATKIFDTGVSESAISGLVLASGSRKLTIQLQRIGRGLRQKTKAENKVILVDLMDEMGAAKRQAQARRAVWSGDEAFQVFKARDFEHLKRLLEEHHGR